MKLRGKDTAEAVNSNGSFKGGARMIGRQAEFEFKFILNYLYRIRRGFGKISLILICPLILSSCPKNEDSPPSPEFDAERAFQDIVRMTKTGQRHSGSGGALENVIFIEKTLSEAGVRHFRDTWEENTPAGKITFQNVIARIDGSNSDSFVALGAHYDTKKLDHCPDFTGANDGASGVAILLEIARNLSKKKLKKSVELVFFDGEECLYSYSEKDGLHGSKRYVKNLKDPGRKRRCEAAVIADMLADRKLNAIIPAGCDPFLAAKFIKTAEKLGFSGYFKQGSIQITDDHSPFLKEGIPAVVIIDFDYGTNNLFWHSSGDKIENISVESLSISGKTINSFIKELLL